jgi:hypothetical protein
MAFKSRAGLCYYRKVANKGVSAEEFCTVTKGKISELSFTNNETEKIERTVDIYKYIADNTCWMYGEKFINFRHVVIEKLREYHNHRIYPQILKFFPVKLCRHCLCFTDENERCCKRCVHRQMILRKCFPVVLVKYIFSFAGVESNKSNLKKKINFTCDLPTVN